MLNDTVRIQPNKSRMQNIIQEKKKKLKEVQGWGSQYTFSV